MSSFRELLNKTLQSGALSIKGEKREQKSTGDVKVKEGESKFRDKSKKSAQNIIADALKQILDYFTSRISLDEMRQQFRSAIKGKSFYNKPPKAGESGTISKQEFVKFLSTWPSSYKAKCTFNYKKYSFTSSNFNDGLNLLLSDSKYKKIIQNLFKQNKKSKFPEKIQLK